MSLLHQYIREQIENEMIIIPNPPTPEERAQETLVVSNISVNPDISRELYEMLDTDIVGLFDSILIGNGYESKRSYIKNLKNSIRPIVKLHKNYFNSPRPHVLANYMGIDYKYDDLETAKTPSYPSGHAAQGYYMAETLSKEFPDCADDLFGLADLISSSRLERGVHLPSDIEAGKLLGLKLAEEYL